MKRITILFLCFTLFFTTRLSAQNQPHEHSPLHHEIGLDAGPASAIGGLIYGTAGVFQALGSALSKTSTKMDWYGQYGIHYYYQAKWWCQVGVKFTAESARTTYYADTLQLIVRDRSTMSLFTLMPSVRFTYLNRPWVRLYSGADIGCLYFWNSDNKNDPSSDEGNKDSNFAFAFNVTPIGVNVGKQFYGMFELNFGFDSFVKLGIGCRF